MFIHMYICTPMKYMYVYVYVQCTLYILWILMRYELSPMYFYFHSLCNIYDVSIVKGRNELKSVSIQ